MKKYYKIIGILALIPMLNACDDSKSYSDLLNEEEKAVNWFMADREIEVTIPADSVFITGANAPYYKMDADGYVYMQVVNRGDMSNRPQKGDRIYFRYKQLNIKDLYNGLEPSWYGNADNLLLVSSSLIYGNTTLPSTVDWGEGLQVPLKYVGYDSEVNLVIKSPQGMLAGQTSCIPYIYNIKYFQAEY